MNDLPVLARLRFVANLILGNGGAMENIGRVPELVVAHRVIADVINVLENHPDAVQLKRTPFPERTPAP